MKSVTVAFIAAEGEVALPLSPIPPRIHEPRWEGDGVVPRAVEPEEEAGARGKREGEAGARGTAQRRRRGERDGEGEGGSRGTAERRRRRARRGGQRAARAESAPGERVGGGGTARFRETVEAGALVLAWGRLMGERIHPS